MINRNLPDYQKESGYIVKYTPVLLKICSVEHCAKVRKIYLVIKWRQEMGRFYEDNGWIGSSIVRIGEASKLLISSKEIIIFNELLIIS